MSDESEVEDEPTLDNWPARLGQRMFEALLGPPDARDVSDLLALAIESYGEAQWWRATSSRQDDEIERLCARIVDLESRRDPEGPSGTTWCRKETRGETTISLLGSAATEREGLRLPDAAPPLSEPRRDLSALRNILVAAEEEASVGSANGVEPLRALRSLRETRDRLREALVALDRTATSDARNATAPPNSSNHPAESPTMRDESPKVSTGDSP